MSLEGDIDLLSRVPLFAELGLDQLRLVAFSATRRSLGPGEVLFRKGEAAESGFVVSDGAIEIASGEGAARKVLETCTRGYLIGELPLFIETRRRSTATAAAPAAVIELTRTVMRRMLAEYPAVAVTLRARFASRVDTTLGELQRVRAMLMAIRPPR